MANNKRDNKPGTDVEVRANSDVTAPVDWAQLNLADERLSDDELRDVATFEDAAALVGGAQNIVDAGDVVGTGFLPLDDKSKLCDVPMILVQWRFSEGDYMSGGVKNPYVTVFAITRHGERYRFTDGSTGICQQLIQATVRMGRTKGLAVPGGLRVSEYTYIDDGVENPAQTFYLNI